MKIPMLCAAGSLLTVLLSVPALGGVKVGLDLRPTSILPGTSANVRVEVANDSAQPIVLKNGVALKVIDPHGDQFFATIQTLSDVPLYRPIPWEFLTSDITESVDRISVAGNGRFVFEIPFSYSTTFFNDRRLSFPGGYRLRLGMVTVAGVELWSEEFVLEVQEPQGVDRDVWRRMLDLTADSGWAWGEWGRQRFGDEVWMKFRGSGYLPYAIGPDQYDREDWKSRREFGLKGPHRDYILLYEAKRRYAVFAGAIERGDHAEAKRSRDETKALLESVLTSTNDEFVKLLAHRELESLPSPQRIQEIIRSLQESTNTTQAQSKVNPSLDCVEQKSSGDWLAWFGYSSELEYDFWLGTKTGENKFEPKPHERGQPETFKPGRFEKVFSVTFDGEPITWFIRGEKATASKNSARCD